VRIGNAEKGWAGWALACWPVGLLACWPVDLLACWPVGLLACWPLPKQLARAANLILQWNKNKNDSGELQKIAQRHRDLARALIPQPHMSRSLGCWI